ncbi:MAG: DUF481 domain-containing protein [Planctomycetes bacterium]|nr:DUF481 domain-containing protein [Planctomycetota bacterium]
MLLLTAVMAAVSAAAPQANPVQTVEVLALSATPIAEGEAAEAPAWKGKATASLSATDGNSNDKGAYADLQMAKDYENGNKWTVGMFWNFRQSRAAGITQRTTFVETKYDVAINEKTYYYGLASAESKLENDVDLRWTLGVGLGHSLVKKEDYQVSIEAGLNHVDESFGINTADDGSYASGRFGYDMKWIYSEKLTFANNASVLFSLDDTDDQNGRMVTNATYKMTESMLAQAGWIWDWDNTPVVGNGRNDNLYTLSLGWTF